MLVTFNGQRDEQSGLGKGLQKNVTSIHRLMQVLLRIYRNPLKQGDVLGTQFKNSRALKPNKTDNPLRATFHTVGPVLSGGTRGVTA